MAVPESVKTGFRDVNGPRNLGLEEKAGMRGMENGGLSCTEWHGGNRGLECQKLGRCGGVKEKEQKKHKKRGQYFHFRFLWPVSLSSNDAQSEIKLNALQKLDGGNLG